MNKKPLNYDELRDQHLDEMIRLAFLYEDALDAEAAAAADKTFVDEQRAKEIFAAAQERLERQKAENARQARAKRLKRMGARLIKAACLILLLNVIVPVAIANIPAIKAGIMNLIIDVQSDRTEIRMVINTDSDLYVPADWKGQYYPSYIPEGYSLDQVLDTGVNALYKNKDDKVIFFDEYTYGATVLLDTEDAEIFYTDINGVRAFAAYKPPLTSITWQVGEKFIFICSNASKEETLKMADSVRRIVPK